MPDSDLGATANAIPLPGPYSANAASMTSSIAGHKFQTIALMMLRGDRDRKKYGFQNIRGTCSGVPLIRTIHIGIPLYTKPPHATR